MKKGALILIAALMTLVLSGCGKDRSYRRPVVIEEEVEYPGYPGTTWKHVRPSVHGFDDGRFKELENLLNNGKYPTTSMVVAVGGDIIFQYGTVNKISYIASCRKSLLAMLYGKYVENGTIDLDKTVGDLNMDDIGGLLPIEKKAKIQDLITARSGVYHIASNTGDDRDYAPARGSQEPGTYFLYNNWDFNAAGYAFEYLTGKDIYEAFRDDIASKIQCENYFLYNQKKSGDLSLSIYPAYHFYIDVFDMARIGLLMLREGKWKDEQVISREWVKRISSVDTPREEMNPTSRRKKEFSYGYMWWIFDNPSNPPELKGAYSARGSKGQYITVIPALDMVVAHHTATGETAWSQYMDILSRIFDAKVE